MGNFMGKDGFVWFVGVVEDRLDPRDKIAKNPLKVENGYIQVPDGPGIGVEFDEEADALDAGGGFLGKRAGGDDDAALVGGFVGEGSGSRQGKGDGAQ